MFLKELMDKEDVVCITMEHYSAMNKKKILQFLLNGPSGHYAKKDKSDTERQILHNITYM